MWLVQSVEEPPDSVWNLQHGQVVVSRCESASSSLAQSSTVIGSRSTVELCSAANPTDPWLLKDPWTQAVRAVPVAQSPHVSTQLQEMEERLEKSLLDKLPADKMETDEHETRISNLEAQLQHLATRQQPWRELFMNITNRTQPKSKASRLKWSPKWRRSATRWSRCLSAR